MTTTSLWYFFCDIYYTDSLSYTIVYIFCVDFVLVINYVQLYFKLNTKYEEKDMLVASVAKQPRAHGDS